MRKKAWILCTAMVVALAGCSNVSDNNTTDIIQVSSETVTTTEAATEVTTTTENETTTESVTESNTPDSTLQSEGSNTGKTEPAATEAKTTESQSQEGEHPMIRGRKSSRRRCMRSMVWCRIITNISEMMSIRSM